MPAEASLRAGALRRRQTTCRLPRRWLAGGWWRAGARAVQSSPDVVEIGGTYALSYKYNSAVWVCRNLIRPEGGVG